MRFRALDSSAVSGPEVGDTAVGGLTRRRLLASAADFAANDVVTHAAALAGTPVRVASGLDDPFQPGVAVLARVLPKTATVIMSAGCHTGPFFTQQEPPSLAFLARHLA